MLDDSRSDIKKICYVTTVFTSLSSLTKYFCEIRILLQHRLLGTGLGLKLLSCLSFVLTTLAKVYLPFSS